MIWERKLQEIVNIRKQTSENSVQSSLNFHPLWVTLYTVHLHPNFF